MIVVSLEQNSTDDIWKTSRRYMPGADATTKHTRSRTQQTLSGAALNRANWHPTITTTTVYSIHLDTLLLLLCDFYRANFKTSLNLLRSFSLKWAFTRHRQKYLLIKEN